VANIVVSTQAYSRGAIEDGNSGRVGYLNF
jgi:hypothetical protein